MVVEEEIRYKYIYIVIYIKQIHINRKLKKLKKLFLGASTQ